MRKYIFSETQFRNLATSLVSEQEKAPESTETATDATDTTTDAKTTDATATDTATTDTAATTPADATAAGGASSGGDTEADAASAESDANSKVTKWESGMTRGHGNPALGDKVWQSGMQRGPANPLGSEKMADRVTRGHANPLTEDHDSQKIQDVLIKRFVQKKYEWISGTETYKVLGKIGHISVETHTYKDDIINIAMSYLKTYYGTDTSWHAFDGTQVDAQSEWYAQSQWLKIELERTIREDIESFLEKYLSIQPKRIIFSYPDQLSEQQTLFGQPLYKKPPPAPAKPTASNDQHHWWDNVHTYGYRDVKALNISAHQVMTFLQISTAFIPVVGLFVSAGIGLIDAGMYYNEGEKKTAGLVALLSVLPAVSEVPAVKAAVTNLGGGMKNFAVKLAKGEVKNFTPQEAQVIKAVTDNAEAVQKGANQAIKNMAVQSAPKATTSGAKNALLQLGKTGLSFGAYGGVWYGYNKTYDYFQNRSRQNVNQSLDDKTPTFNINDSSRFQAMSDEELRKFVSGN